MISYVCANVCLEKIFEILSWKVAHLALFDTPLRGDGGGVRGRLAWATRHLHCLTSLGHLQRNPHCGLEMTNHYTPPYMDPLTRNSGRNIFWPFGRHSHFWWGTFPFRGLWAVKWPVGQSSPELRKKTAKTKNLSNSFFWGGGGKSYFTTEFLKFANCFHTTFLWGWYFCILCCVVFAVLECVRENTHSVATIVFATLMSNNSDRLL